MSDKIKKEVSQQLDPFQISFDNVAHDVLKLDALARENRSLMEQWNNYFMQSIKKLQSDVEKIKKPQGNLEILDTFEEKITEITEAQTRLSSVLQNQQKSMDGLKDDVTQLQKNLGSYQSMQNKYTHSVLDEVKTLKSQITIIQQKTLSQTTISHQHHQQPRHVVVQKTTSKKIPRKITPQNIIHELSAAEQAVLYIFVSKNRPLSVKEVSAHYGRTESTVRNIINRLKKRQIPLLVTKGAKGIILHDLQKTFRKNLLAKSDVIKKLERI